MRAIKQADTFQRSIDALLKVRAAQAVKVPVVDKVFPRREHAIQSRGLKDHAYAAANLCALRQKIVTKNADASGLRPNQRGEDPEKSRLAAAIGSEKAEDFPALNVEADAVQGGAIRQIAISQLPNLNGNVGQMNA
jgi:hypothetical protein